MPKHQLRPQGDFPTAGLIRRLAALFYDFLLSVALLMVVTLIYKGIQMSIIGEERLRQLSDAGALDGDPLLSTLLVMSLFGFFAKILIAPAFCTQNSVATELIAMADQLGAIAYIDAPIGTTYAQALAGRGPAGTINFNTSSDRVRLCYPHVKVYDPVLNAERLEPLSARAAGLRAKVDLARERMDQLREQLNDAISGGNVTPAADVVAENAVEADTEAAEPSTEA